MLGLIVSSIVREENRTTIFADHAQTQMLISDISIYYRNEVMRDAARRTALFVIARYGQGGMAVFPRDIIKLIANEVWKTREDPIWLDASE